MWTIKQGGQFKRDLKQRESRDPHRNMLQEEFVALNPSHISAMSSKAPYLAPHKRLHELLPLTGNSRISLIHEDKFTDGDGHGRSADTSAGAESAGETGHRATGQQTRGILPSLSLRGLIVAMSYSLRMLHAVQRSGKPLQQKGNIAIEIVTEPFVFIGAPGRNRTCNLRLRRLGRYHNRQHLAAISNYKNSTLQDCHFSRCLWITPVFCPAVSHECPTETYRIAEFPQLKPVPAEPRQRFYRQPPAPPLGIGWHEY